jgi:arylsulfatase A-like enzyme
MRRSARIGRAAPVAACLALAVVACGPPAALRPNLVLITADGVRPDWLVCYRADRAFGEEACALGERGALYAWALATAPSGAPSAASLLTSTYPAQHGVADEPSTFLGALGPPTLAEVLRDGGYATAAFVSSPELNRSRHLDRGFDHFDDHAPAPGGAGSGPVGVRARTWATSARPPWFVWVHFGEAHGPFPAVDAASDLAAYGEALRRLDRQLSQLVAVLDSADAPPAILLTALHGQRLGSDGRLGHGTSVELAEIHVPLLWRAPRAGAGPGVGRRIHRPVSLIDVAPTLVEAAGLRAPASFEGIPLPHSDGDAPADDRRLLFAEHPDAIAVVRGDELAILPREGPRSPSAAAHGPPVRAVGLSLQPGPPGAATATAPLAAGRIAGLRAEVGSLPTAWRREPPEAERPR